MGYWAGHISNGQSGALSTGPSGAALTTSVLYDSLRQEADSTYDSGWVVLYPGTANAVWRQIATYFQAGGTFNLLVPLTTAPSPGDAYEVFQVARPEEWTISINWALENAYPERHKKVIFEVPENPYTLVYDWRQLAIENSIPDPSQSLALSVNPNIAIPASSPLETATYYFGFTWFNALGETFITSTLASIAVTDGQVINVDPTALAIPDSAIGFNLYMSVQPNDAVTLGKIDQWALQIDPVAPPGTPPTQVVDSVLYTVNVLHPTLPTATLPPVYNTTAADIRELLGVQRRINPEGGPEAWIELGPDFWTPIGETSFQINYNGFRGMNLRLIGLAMLTELVQETDVTNEPVEMILAGAEYYQWQLLSKSSTIQGANWEQLAATALGNYTAIKESMAMEQPRRFMHSPNIDIYW